MAGKPADTRIPRDALEGTLLQTAREPAEWARRGPEHSNAQDVANFAMRVSLFFRGSDCFNLSGANTNFERLSRLYIIDGHHPRLETGRSRLGAMARTTKKEALTRCSSRTYWIAASVMV